MDKGVSAAKWSLQVVRVDKVCLARLALRTRGTVIAFVDLTPTATMMLSKALLDYTLAAATGSRTQGTTMGRPTLRTLADDLLALDNHSQPAAE